ncbi:very short patch repair endonuclease [Rhodococcus sp. AH-ZY2]|uniref:very short patch repair endonuclease n=1 Tax=Rhodococcus sp. AH-ZY2 TaxID=3047468 RepID=UPI0027DEC540|nr:very short patch repair endonuclease [Rhodococcus sp. AH-ZY2]WML64538.1 very short patch repair endonuclease [Rhodococcus sp. AH-ZY2]
MQKMPRRDTNPEVQLRRALHQRGLRFRIHGTELPGRPDIVFPRARIAVFVDGCFWHYCPDHGTLPKNNRDWWAAKLEANVVRDRAKDDALRAPGWLPVHVWEHDEPSDAADTLRSIWEERRNRIR